MCLISRVNKVQVRVVRLDKFGGIWMISKEELNNRVDVLLGIVNTQKVS